VSKREMKVRKRNGSEKERNGSDVRVKKTKMKKRG
jgi:hypothetical protein